ncbi:hypothetical protein HMPREF9135_0260 [Segatella baroniae F0067]|uniref:Uncharacterized protein n=1 Tax=Segatella baroniae F0067 TaxID=1115809 RepID=U2NPA6_9BACT|nr:hypothetical protein HMPREF9135_0260 [Segatella baroniae F0067]
MANARRRHRRSRRVLPGGEDEWGRRVVWSCIVLMMAPRGMGDGCARRVAPPGCGGSCAAAVHALARCLSDGKFTAIIVGLQLFREKTYIKCEM